MKATFPNYASLVLESPIGSGANDFFHSPEMSIGSPLGSGLLSRNVDCKIASLITRIKIGLHMSYFCLNVFTGISLCMPTFFELSFLISVSTSSRDIAFKLNVASETCFLICRMLGCKSNFLKAILTGSFSPSVLYKRYWFTVMFSFLGASEKKQFNVSATLTSSVKFSPDSIRVIFLEVVPLSVKKGLIVFQKHCFICEVTRI